MKIYFFPAFTNIKSSRICFRKFKRKKKQILNQNNEEVIKTEATKKREIGEKGKPSTSFAKQNKQNTHPLYNQSKTFNSSFVLALSTCKITAFLVRFLVKITKSFAILVRFFSRQIWT